MRRTSLLPVVCCLTLLAALPARAQQKTAAPNTADWQYLSTLKLPAERKAKYFDFILPVHVFDGARSDLADLRIYDAAGREVPYSLRVLNDRTKDEKIAAEVFNRSEGPDHSTELSLDLGKSFPHNRVEVNLTGDNFRRRAVLEGSDDSMSWNKITEKPLLRFTSLANQDNNLTYPTSRYRYLRLRLYQDPQVDTAPPVVNSASVHRRITVPGEYVTRTAELGQREPVRINGEPGSAWFADLGGDHVPVERLHATVAQQEFARNFTLEGAGPPDEYLGFSFVTGGQWQRRQGEHGDLEIYLGSEQKFARLKLLIEDFANPPLSVTKLTYTAAARQVVIAASDWKSPLSLYYGDPLASAPNYDFHRNLPTNLEPPPARLNLSPREENPAYVPPPLPFTERWPGLVYVVLIAVCLVLARVIYRVARTSIELHDKQQAATAAE